MAGAQTRILTFAGLKGRDGSSTSVGVPPELGGIPMDRCAEAVNVTFDRTTCARKRSGSTAYGMTFTSGGPFATRIAGIDACIAVAGSRLWAIDATGQIGYSTNFTTGDDWVEPSKVDTPIDTGVDGFRALPFEDLTYLPYQNSVNRLAAFDGTTIRRAGMGTPNAPTVADTGAGTYTATLRYYQIRMGVLSGTDVQRMGEASATAGFTPSGAGSAARVTKPTTVDDATHWRVEVSLDDAVYYVLSSWIAVATTTYDDSAATTTYSTNDASPLVGRYTPFPGVPYLTSGEGRLIGMDVNNRIHFSSAIGETSEEFFDWEYVPNTTLQKYYIDLEDEGLNAKGIAGPFQGAYWAFQLRAIHKLIPMPFVESPFRRIRMFPHMMIGTIDQNSIVIGLDEYGQQAMYWLSETGPFRMTTGGLQFMGEDIVDVWRTVMDARTGQSSELAMHGVFLHQNRWMVWWVSRNATTHAPDTILVFDTKLARVENGQVRGGWTIWETGSLPTAMCSSATRTRIFTGLYGSAAVVYYNESATTDNGTEFQAYIDIPERPYSGMFNKTALVSAEVMCDDAVDLRLTIGRDQSAETIDCDVSIETGQTRAVFEDATLPDADTLAFRIGDAAASAAAWNLDALSIAIEQREQRFP